MAQVKAVLFDADGVTIVPTAPFALRYAAHKGFDFAEIEPFFKGDFLQAMVGNADLKALLERHRAAWRWEGEVSELMRQWFEAENHPNLPLLQVIAELRQRGISCYLATNQERYRTDFIRTTMFPNVFDGVFASAEIGATKPSAAYFQAVLSQLVVGGIEAKDIVYFDDSQANIDAARSLGIRSQLYRDGDDVKACIEFVELQE